MPTQPNYRSGRAGVNFLYMLDIETSSGRAVRSCTLESLYARRPIPFRYLVKRFEGTAAAAKSQDPLYRKIELSQGVGFGWPGVIVARRPGSEELGQSRLFVSLRAFVYRQHQV
jgi:hypothetical protein